MQVKCLHFAAGTFPFEVIRIHHSRCKNWLPKLKFLRCFILDYQEIQFQENFFLYSGVIEDFQVKSIFLQIESAIQ